MVYCVVSGNWFLLHYSGWTDFEIELNVRTMRRERRSSGEAQWQMPTGHVGPPPRSLTPPHFVSYISSLSSSSSSSWLIVNELTVNMQIGSVSSAPLYRTPTWRTAWTAFRARYVTQRTIRSTTSTSPARFLPHFPHFTHFTHFKHFPHRPWLLHNCHSITTYQLLPNYYSITTYQLLLNYYLITA